MNYSEHTGLIKSAECISCKRFFTCAGRPSHITACASFEQDPEMIPWPGKEKE